LDRAAGRNFEIQEIHAFLHRLAEREYQSLCFVLTGPPDPDLADVYAKLCDATELVPELDGEKVGWCRPLPCSELCWGLKVRINKGTLTNGKTAVK